VAKIEGKANKAKGPGYTGRMMVDVYRGQLRVRKWPRKRGRNLHPKTLAQMEWFRQANELAKYVAPQQQVLAREAAAGSPLLPRDLLIMAMAGRMFAIDFIDGRMLFPMAARAGISESLDVLSHEVGAVLVRAATYWEGLSPGLAGSVLTSAGPGQPPVWAGGVGAGGSWDWPIDYNSQSTVTSGGLQATKGNIIECRQPFEVKACAATFTPTLTGSYQCHIAELNGAGVIQAIASSNVLTPASTDRLPRFFTIAAALVPVKLYALMLTRTDATPTTQLTWANQANGAYHLPVKMIAGMALTSVLPMVGNTITIPGGTPFIGPIGLKTDL